MAISAGVAMVVGGVGGGIISANGARDAANTQASAANNANNTQLQMYNQTRADQQPWMQSGAAALGQLNSQMPDLTRNFSMSDFQADPGYDFRMQQGQQAIERSAAARGGVDSGATLKALTDYSQGQASQEYQNAYNRFTNNQNNTYNKLSSLAGVGQVANNSIASAGQNTANQIGQNTVGAANGAAASQIAGANAINGGIGQGMNTWMQQSMMNRMFPQTPGMQQMGGVPMTGESYGSFANIA